MLRINRLMMKVKTTSGTFGFDEQFNKKVNFIASTENTQGKSSCLEAIYYCLGIEELIGGKKEKALKPVFRKILEHNGKEIPVLESNFYLEIQNKEQKIVTIYRSANKQNYDSNLITLYYSGINDLGKDGVHSEDMYVHSPGSATHKKGFHKFLESFINWSLPEVPSYEEYDKKLYLQLIFSSMFIEQKRGWSNLFATLPTYFKIKDAKKRIIEFLIGLDSLKNEKLKLKYKSEELEVNNLWAEIIHNIKDISNDMGCKVYRLPPSPTILEEDFINTIGIFKVKEGNDEEIPLMQYIEELVKRLDNLSRKNISVGDNIEELQEDLIAINNKITYYERTITDKQKELLYENASVNSIIRNLEIINKDILNNKDTLKLKKMGSSEEWLINNNICPTCHQHIHDSLLPQDLNYDFMTLEENIKHLEAQKKMMEYGMENNKLNSQKIEKTIKSLEDKMKSFRKIAKSISNDIYSNDGATSEAIIRQKLSIEHEIDSLNENNDIIRNLFLKFKNLSERWSELLTNKGLLPNESYTIQDKNKIKELRNSFVNNLEKFGFKSIIDKSTIEINNLNLLPSSEGFNMNFDSSASDNIRAIWAFTLALMQTSNKYNGNHPNILIFDEPDQQSVIINDMKNFFEVITDMPDDCQVIIGITIKEEETKNAITNLDDKYYKLILLKEKSISLLDN
ncbi:hypothetical protein [Bacillus cereus]|uniref:hypothetical protein n=2 Tax=Bacillus cereus group TaxID=86661 RepID=UPI000BFB8E45|nr:hypothetical protein [Bacillus cereus]PGM23026.1 hypothetical protein CN940_11685 [Bacillus cereus]